MTCVRSNHDIKFIPSGKDGKNIAFYVTNYATKSQLSTYQMVPLIAASKKRLDEDESHASNSVQSRSKAMITKCLNKITTETEVSGSHVSHFLLGHLDKKTSHNFTGLNLHSAWACLANWIKKDNDLDEAIALTEVDNEIIGNADKSDKPGVDTNNENENIQINPGNPVTANADNNDDDNDSDDNDDDDDDDDNNTSYTVTTGNQGLVFVNQMTDYINRGDALKYMCLWEYVSKVYKKKFSDDDLKKHKEKDNKKSKRECEQVHQFASVHPQSETHWQKVRLKNSAMVPTLSTLPPSSKENKDKYQKSILLLFKPFTSFEELYNGISWNETYSDFLEVTEHTQYIENLQELHNGKEKTETGNNDENNDDVVDDILDDECDDDTSQLDEADTGLDSETNDALDIIKNTPWLDESISNHQTDVSDFLPVFHNTCQWKDDIKKQNQDKVNDVGPEESEIQGESPTQFTATHEDNDVDVDFSTERCTDTQPDSIEKIRDDTILEFNLNKKQKKAFELAIDNVIKRHKKEKTDQVIGYVGGPGGTGKSQVIKAIVHFHEQIKMKHTLKLCANTGTASKHIGGSTTSTLFGFGGKKKDIPKLQRNFEKVETIIVDEVSMIGCRQLAKIAKALSYAKCSNSSLPFGGVDIIFFGDFIQFRPVKDTPLYYAWMTQENVRGKKDQSEINKQLGMHLWRQVNHIVLLDEQMRVQDKNYLAMLNRLREGKCTDKDIAMLSGRVVGQTVDITSIADAPIITFGNQLVMAINDLFVARHSQHTPVYVSTAKDFIGSRKNKKNLPKKVATKIKKWANTATQGLPRELQLFVGMPVIVTNNITTALGITNGTTGVVRSIHLTNGGVISGDAGFHHVDVDYVVVELHDINMRPLDGLPPSHVPIFLKKDSFAVRIPGKETPYSVNRTHFPLVPRFSCTSHKSQGQTLAKAIVDLVPPGKIKNVAIEFAYVPLSRVRRLDDLTILRPFDPNILKVKVHEGCTAMMAEFKARDLCKDM